MTAALSRRSLLAAALATGAAVPLAGATPGRPAAAAPPRLTLPRPTGPHRIGTVDLHVVDRSRVDPVTGGHRELMASVWYPAGRDAVRHPLAPMMPAAPLRALLDSVGFGADSATSPLTAGRQGAPVLRTRDRLPLILYSHGNDGYRAEATIMVQELASHGYAVVTVDSTYDTYCQFHDGRVTVPSEVEGFTPWDHAHDVLSVLDRLEDSRRRPLPAGLGSALDFRRMGMAGWSKGATATALVMNLDRRVRAGLSLDGPLQSNPPPEPLDRPFLLMTAEFSRAAEPSVEDYWHYHLHGWHLNLHATGAAHTAYIDHQWLIPQLARITGMSDEELTDWIGTLSPARAVRIQQAYPLAFFDLHLRHRRQPLLEGPSRAFPEVEFIP